MSLPASAPKPSGDRRSPSEPGAASLPPLPSHPRVVESLLDLVGDTALIEIRRLDAEAPRGRVFGKMEQQNPGGSVKDRICLAMIEGAEARGALPGPGGRGVVVEPTSGNTGIGLALICAAKGYRCILTMPASMSLERRQLLEAYGAEVVLTEPELQMEGAVAKAREIAAGIPGAVLLGQFDNLDNPRVHAETTAREILHAMANAEGAGSAEPRHALRIDAFVAGVGTGGTVTGVGRVLKRLRPPPRVVAVEPESCATLSRGERGPSKIQGLAAGFVPRIYDASVVDEVRTVSERAAYDTKVALARKEGLLVGISAGAAVRVALDVARELGPDANVVTVLCDTGERYFSLDEYFR